MRIKLLFLATLAALTILPDAASAQAESPYYRPRYDDGYRGPPPPPPPGYYEDRRYEDRRYEDRRYRERQQEYYPPPAPRQRAGGVFCAREGQFCQFQGPAVVRYGAAGRFVRRQAFNGIPCTNQAFGDPAVGMEKACFID